MTVRAPAAVGIRLEEVDTPALILDLDAFETNVRRLADAVPPRVRVRAHAKTHKCPEIGKRQIAAGAVGVCCQKVSEAEAMVDGGIDDVLVSNEVVGAGKLERLAALAQAIAAPPNLRFAGIHAYHGRAQHIRSNDERRAVIGSAAAAVRGTKVLLEKNNVHCPIVTGAGSGTFMFEVELGAWDEIQPGSYVFMDWDYARNEWAPPMPRFEHSLFVLATIMSRPGPQVAIVDAGLKASSVDSGMPGVWERPGLAYTHASDEHGWVEIVAGARAGAALPALGEKLLLVPGHCDPTVNLYDWYVCVRGGVVEALWPITARGALY